MLLAVARSGRTERQLRGLPDIPISIGPQAESKKAGAYLVSADVPATAIGIDRPALAIVDLWRREHSGRDLDHFAIHLFVS
jgi:hypothetical protein